MSLRVLLGLAYLGYLYAHGLIKAPCARQPWLTPAERKDAEAFLQELSDWLDRPAHLRRNWPPPVRALAVTAEICTCRSRERAVSSQPGFLLHRAEMMNAMLRYLMLALGWWAFGLPTQAQPGMGEFVTDTVPLQTSRLAQTMTEVGRQATVITAEEIGRLPVQSVNELLRYVSGVEVQARGPFGAQADVLMRGSNFNQVLMLLDGMRLNDPLTGHFNGYLPVSLPEIARLEVLRGPAASLYGADAVGGVIHIITKTFAPVQRSTDARTQGQLGLGQYGLTTGQMGFFLPGKRLTVGGGLSSNRTDGQPLPPDSLFRSDVATYTASLSARADWGRGWRAMARAAFDQRLFHARYFYTRSSFDESREQVRQGWVQGRLAHQGNQSQTYLDLAHKVMEDSFLFNPAFPANVHRTQFSNLQLHHQQHLSSELQLASGLQLSRRSIVSSDRGDHQDLHAGAYAMAFWQPVSDLSLTGSLRGDYDSNYGFELLPQVNVAYLLLDRLNLRASAGRSIRAADYTERYIGFELPGVITPGRNLGNPELEAERSWSYEAGLDGYLWPFLKLSGTGFYRQGRNLIDYVLTPGRAYIQPEKVEPDSLYFLTQNLDSLDTYGTELELQLTHYWDRNLSLRYRAGLLWVQSVSSQDLPSKYLANHAQTLLTQRLSLQLRRFHLAVTTLYKQRDTERAVAIGVALAPSYLLVNAQLSYELAPGLALFGQVQNLTNTRYQDILGAYMPTRWALGGLRWQL